MTDALVVLDEQEKNQIRRMSIIVSSAELEFRMFEESYVKYLDGLRIKYEIEVPHFFDPGAGAIFPQVMEETDG